MLEDDVQRLAAERARRSGGSTDDYLKKWSIRLDAEQVAEQAEDASAVACELLSANVFGQVPEQLSALRAIRANSFAGPPAFIEEVSAAEAKAQQGWDVTADMLFIANAFCQLD